MPERRLQLQAGIMIVSIHMIASKDSASVAGRRPPGEMPSFADADLSKCVTAD